MSIKNFKGKIFAIATTVTMLGSLFVGGVFTSAEEPAPTPEPVVVYSEGFETLTDMNLFAGYGAFQTNVNLIKVSDEDFYSGSKSLKFAGGWNGLGTQAKGASGNVVFTANTDYILSFWIKGNFYSCSLYTPSDTENNFMQKFEINGGGLFDQWTEIKLPFHVGEKTVMTQGTSGMVMNKPFEVSFQNAFNEMYLDDITIREGTLPTASPTPTATATPTPTATPTQGTPTPQKTENKTAYVPVSKAAIAKVAGTTKTTAKVTVYKKAATNKGKWTTIAKNKTIAVKSVSGLYAKVTVKVGGKTKTGYVKVTSLKFSKSQAGKVISSTKAYKKASTKGGYYQSFAKNKTFTIQSISGSYYKTTVKVVV